MINVSFIGRLGADAELRTSKNGKQYLSMRVATDEYKNGERGTTWVSVTYANDRAVKLIEYMKKGRQVNVFGTLTVGSYQNKNGETVPTIDVMADRIDYVSSGNSTSAQSSTSDDATQEPKKAAEMVPSVSAPSVDDSADDDLPF